MENRNPVRITIIILGILFILLGLFALLLMPPLSFISSILSMVGGIGLLLRKNFARYLIIFVAFGCIYGLFPDTIDLVKSFNKGSPPIDRIVQDVVGWIIISGIIYFFTRPKVKEQFK
jgi:hypothetical protein